MLKVVPQKDWEIIRQYLDNPANILISEDVFNALPPLVQEAAESVAENYCYEDPDVCAELVADESHYFISCCEDAVANQKRLEG